MSKTAVHTNIRNIRPFILAVGLVCLSVGASAQTRMQVRIGTGDDDMRGGNRASITIELTDREILQEQLLSSGLGSRSNSTSLVTFPRTIAATQIRSIRIRHDGSPRAGHPFDTYDNWDLRTLRVNLANGSFQPTLLLYDSARDLNVGDKVERFTGALREKVLPIRAVGAEPDFTVTRITATPSRSLLVRVSNIGSGPGRVTNITCLAVGRTVTRATSALLSREATEDIEVSFVPRGRVTCSVSGVDAEGRPEVVTTNNRSSPAFF